jgi:hypothetical protein
MVPEVADHGRQRGRDHGLVERGEPQRQEQRAEHGADGGRVLVCGHVVRCIQSSIIVTSTRHDASYWWSMILSENRYPLFGIMLYPPRCAASRFFM